MVLLQKVRVTNLEDKAKNLAVTMSHRRKWPAYSEAGVIKEERGDAALIQDSAYHRTLFSIQGAGEKVKWSSVRDYQDEEKRVNATVFLSVPANGSREITLKLPSPAVDPQDQATLVALNYEMARGATLKFWSDYLARGARFQVPEPVVNDLFRASLWHALRLPRRHGGAGERIQIDLPYSNFAYSQTGTPWPVNQAVYVDYMLYDLRGYHDLSVEEL